jgi:hypothetical protein
MFCFSLDDLRDRAFEGLAPPALEGLFIASTPIEDRTSSPVNGSRATATDESLPRVG